MLFGVQGTSSKEVAMAWDFTGVKDVLDVVVVPLAIFFLGLLLPWAQERQRRRAFRSLIARELGEASPDPAVKESDVPWHRHLRKRFLHEQIFADVATNRDFILSLPPDLAYNAAQMWIHFEKATKSSDARTVQEHGARFVDHLKGMCAVLGSKDLETKVLKPWRTLMESHERVAPTSASETVPTSAPADRMLSCSECRRGPANEKNYWSSSSGTPTSATRRKPERFASTFSKTHDVTGVLCV
jgi:hypothetical protein